MSLQKKNQLNTKEGSNRDKYCKTFLLSSKVTVVSSSLSVVTLNVNRLNCLIKRQRKAEWIGKMIQIYTVYKRLTLALKTEDWK